MWDDIQAWWANLDEEKKRVLGDAIIGQAGVEGNLELREPITPNLAGEIAEARIPPPTPLEEKGAYMEGRGGYDAAVTAMNAPKKPKEDKDDDLWNQIFLMSLMEEMQGGDPGQAPGVVLGARSGGLPSMMGQFKRQQKPWWIV
tara:strand:- start:167 stop:598 length:432 start_codon:yes stop_codon:yes gene_type:complete